MPGAGASSSTAREPNRLDRAGTYPPGPSRLRGAASYPPPSPVGAPIPLRRSSATPSSITYSTWDARLSPIGPPDQGKGCIDGAGTPADSLSPLATGSIPSSAVSPRDLSDEAPIRIRRVGALGISVGSDSEDGDVSVDPSSTSERPRKRGRLDVDRNRGSISSDELEFGDDADEESAGGGRRGGKSRKKVKGVAEGQFRSIVDDLTRESESDFVRSCSIIEFLLISSFCTVTDQALKAQLRLYEIRQLPQEVRKERVLEVRYFGGLAGFVLSFLARFEKRRLTIQ